MGSTLANAKTKVAVMGPRQHRPSHKRYLQKWAVLGKKGLRPGQSQAAEGAKAQVCCLECGSWKGTAQAMPMDRTTIITLRLICPAVTSSICSVRTYTAGSASTTTITQEKTHNWQEHGVELSYTHTHCSAHIHEARVHTTKNRVKPIRV